MNTRVRLLPPKGCLPPHDQEHEGDGFPRLHGFPSLPMWLLVLGSVALIAYVVFFSLRG